MCRKSSPTVGDAPEEMGKDPPKKQIPDVEPSKEENYDDEEMSLSPQEYTLHKMSPQRRVLKAMLGISACLDFFSFLLPLLLLPDEVEEEAPKKFLFFGKKPEVELPEETEVTAVTSFLEQLDAYSFAFGMAFSLLWFIDAFMEASRTREKVLTERDKKRLLSHEEQEVSANGPGQNGQAVDKQTPSVDDDDSMRGGWGVYACAVGLQVVMLPVGFYLLAYHTMRVLASPGEQIDEGMETIEVVHKDESGVPDAYETLTTKSQMALGYAIFHHFALLFSHAAATHGREKMRSTIRRLGRRISFFALRNPRKARRRFAKFMRALRWVKYLAPLIGTANKLRGNIIDLIKKHRQAREASKARRAKEKMFKELTPEERQEAAAVVLQSVWRAKRSRKAYEAVKLIRGNAEKFAALRMQRVFRGMLARARAKIEAKKREFQELQEIEKSKKKNKRKGEHMSAEDRRRMYELQAELEADAKTRLGRKMLLRPNTKFAVTWKILFVVCVIVEITQLALKPKLEQYKDAKTKKVMNLDEILDHHLVPTPIEEWNQCAFLYKVKEPKKKPRVLKAFGKLFKRGQQEDEGSEVVTVDKMGPWYCYKPYTTIQSWYIRGLRFFLTETLNFMGIICFLDVFVTFFTGELDDRGMLVPKAFFTRWILPGLTLQLLVNPKMGEISMWVNQVLKGAFEVGPIRSFRWLSALFFPIMLFLVTLMERMWRHLLHKENLKVEK